MHSVSVRSRRVPLKCEAGIGIGIGIGLKADNETYEGKLVEATKKLNALDHRVRVIMWVLLVTGVCVTMTLAVSACLFLPMITTAVHEILNLINDNKERMVKIVLNTQNLTDALIEHLPVIMDSLESLAINLDDYDEQ